MRGLLFIGALVVAAVGALGLILGFIFDPARTVVSSLIALTFATSTSVGALALLMVGYVVSAHWLQRLRPLTEALALLTPLFGLLLIPLFIGLDEVYLWAAPEQAHLTHHELDLLEHKAAWLNEGAFIGRGIAYVVIWTALTAVLFVFRKRPRSRAAQWTSGLGLPIISLAFTFAAFDWQMSLNPFWVSTMFGVYILAGGFLCCLATLALLSPLTIRAGVMPSSLNASSYPLGRLLLAFVIFWAYIAFMQLLIIWSANLPEEVVFYERRIEGGWQVVTGILVVAHFFLPFFVLLFRYVKLVPAWLSAIGGWLVFMHAYDVVWITLPSLRAPASSFRAQDLAGLALVSGITVAFTLLYARRERHRLGGVDLVEEGTHGQR